MELSIIETATGSILRDVIRDILEGAGLGILRGPAGIGKSFALDLITEELEAEGAVVVRVTVSPATGGSISSFTRAVLAQYRIETGSTADGVEALAELLRGYADAIATVCIRMNQAENVLALLARLHQDSEYSEHFGLADMAHLAAAALGALGKAELDTLNKLSSRLERG